MNRNARTIAGVVLLLACVGLVTAAAVDGQPTGEAEIIGIDLGTTYSCVGVWRNGQVEIIANDQGNRITPSYVAWDPDSGERLIGDAAKNQVTSNAANTVYDVKRLIGRQFSDKTVQDDMKHWPFGVERGANDKPMVRVNNNEFAPEEVSAMVLGKMKQIAEDYLGHEVKDAVVTVPAYFNDAQRQATRDAGTIAGLNVVRIINEPTAAALAYGMDKKGSEKNVLVFDLGGGTFDVTLLTIDNGIFEVMATNGDTHLGGQDFDERVLKHMMKVVKKKLGVDISGDMRAIQKLRKAVELAKRALSTQHSTRVEVESLVNGLDFSETLTRARFEELNADLFKRTMGPVAKVLEDAGLKKSEVDEIVLVGGSSRIPKVQQLLKDFFNGKEPNRGVNPDEAVAFGAAVQGGILNPNQKMDDNLVIIDVTSLSLGIETVGGAMTVIVPRNTNIPTKKSQVFSTNEDNQDTVLIQVYQGERAMAKDNHPLGQFALTGIPPAPRGIPQIEVTFQLDANGMLNVKAREKTTDREEEIVINVHDGSLTEEDIERMKADAERHAEADRVARERVDARNGLESYVYSLRNSLNEDSFVEKLDGEEVEELRDLVDETLDWLDENELADAEMLNEKKHELEQAASPLMTKAYSSAGSGNEEEEEDYNSL